MPPQRLPTVGADDGTWGDILRQYLMKEHTNDDTDNAANGGHKTITVVAGTTSAGTAPIKLTSGSLMTSPEAGAIEFLTDSLYFTQTTGTTRKKIATYDDTSGATGDIYYRDSGGYFTRLAAGGNGNLLAISSGIPAWTNSLVVSDTSFTIVDNGDNTKQAVFDASNIDTATTKTFVLPGGGTTGILVTTGASQSLTNKTLSHTSNTVNVIDTAFSISDAVDTNKVLRFDPSLITTGNVRTLQPPDANTVIVGTDVSQTLTNKTINASNNTLSNITTTHLAASTLVTESEGIASNDNDTTLPTSAAVKDYVDNNAGGGISWSEVTGTSQSAAVNTGYITNNAGLVTVTIPTTATVGDTVRIAGKGAGGWRIAQNSGETIHFGNQSTTTGTGGRLDSTHRYDSVELICITADTDWLVLSSVGNINIT